MNPSSIPLELTFGQTVWVSVISALATAVFTAGLVTIGARWIVMGAEDKRAIRVREADQERANDLREADERRADAMRKADQERADLQRELSEAHDRRRQDHEHEFQSRQALRETYARLLVMQRQSRQASLALSKAEGSARVEAETAAVDSHNAFLDEYHRLALDADPDMWEQLRTLRQALDAMLLWAREGDTARCEQLYKSARAARQNLEGRFRKRLKYGELQQPKDVGDLRGPPRETLL
jgi:hypothetical protein